MTEPLFTIVPGLTDRQAHALKTIREHQPVRSDTLGAHLHAFRLAQHGSGHTADETCDWCTSDGRSVGDALARKGLVRYVRGKGWVTSEYPNGLGRPASSQIGVGDDWPEDMF